MKTLIAASVLFVVCLNGVVHAEGLIYRIPKDGTWVEFTMDGMATSSDDSEVTLVGKLRLSSVGKVEVDGQPCRWIEFRTDGIRNDEKFTDTIKLLIPEKNLTKGQDPLKHIIKAWSKHSHTAGGARAVEVTGVGKENLRNRTFQLLHGPYDNPQKLEKTLVESKLGKQECEGIKATETWGGIKYTCEIRLHDKAPFGVVTHQSVFELMEKGAMTTKFTLSDFGTNAVSDLPDSK